LLWVVDDAGEAVAFLAARIAGDRLHIDELDVRQDRQGLGLGRRLLAHAKAEALARGLARLSLTTFRSIPWNGPYYARFGFRGWPAAEAAEDVQQALANETSRGLKDRCAMVMDL
jgi:GNAT superfamily N-acetyltransferase